MISIHALREESDGRLHLVRRRVLLFLSTPSARRATRRIVFSVFLHFHFYPRPPRGERHDQIVEGIREGVISIHALREESDLKRFLDGKTGSSISIHALREESDSSGLTAVPGVCYFYPRPPRGERRRDVAAAVEAQKQFLSTPSARRATVHREMEIHHLADFYPRPPRGERLAKVIVPPTRSRNFYPRPPRGERQQKQRENTLLLSHYTPLCTNCKEMLTKQTAKSHRYLRKRLVFRCEASRKTMCAAGSHWLDIKRSARCLGQILGAVQRARPWSGSCCPTGRTADCPRQGRSGRSALL